VAVLRPEVPPRLAGIIDRCLQKDPAARIQTGDEVARLADEVRGRDLRAPPLMRSFLRNAQVSTLFFLASLLGGKLGLIGIILFVQLVLVARRLLRTGYAFEDIRTALLAEAEVQREEADEMQQRRWTRRLNTLWHRLWAGRFGRFFFRVAGTGIKPPERRAIASADPTELVLGRSVLAVYAALPPADRAQVPEVPEVVARLEKEAEALRAAGRTGEYLVETVAALENLRLSMLKLRAGTGSVGDLTEWLERAREIGDYVDRRIEGEGEVRKFLGG
jgi:hypothetical protein